MRAIYKYGPFTPGERLCKISGRVVHFGIQNGELFVWSEVVVNDISYSYYSIVGTGDALGDKKYVATVIEKSGLVWHLLENI